MIMIKKRKDGKNISYRKRFIVSAIKSGASPDYARTIAQDVERSTKEDASTQDIRGKVLSMLKAKNPEWERNWLVCDSAVKKMEV